MDKSELQERIQAAYDGLNDVACDETAEDWFNEHARNSDSPVVAALTLALACLEDDKAGIVGVPKEATLDMEEVIWAKACNMNCVCRYAPDEVYEDTIKAAPETNAQRVLRELEEAS